MSDDRFFIPSEGINVFLHFGQKNLFFSKKYTGRAIHWSGYIFWSLLSSKIPFSNWVSRIWLEQNADWSLYVNKNMTRDKNWMLA